LLEYSGLRWVTKPFAVAFCVTAAVLFRAPNLLAQQPFYTDDADVTEKGKRHLECSNEYDRLPPEVFPNLRQNTLVCRFAFGLPANLEVGADAPLLAIGRAGGNTPQTSLGIGDFDFGVKWNFRKPPQDSHAFSLAAGFNMELPSGRAKENLGSGLHDYVANFIVQKKLTDKTTMHLNSGIIFAGNQTTGAIGVANTRGQVYTEGASLVRQITQKLDLGADLYEAFSPQFQFSRGQLQGLLGGNYEFHRGYTFDFGFVLGAFAAAPRAGVQVGFSHDF
jgi:hypothetical protein